MSMYLSEQFLLYRLAYTLVTDEGYEILHINRQEEELWLEKYQGNTSKVIRLIHKGFDWKNHLKNDIKIVFQKLFQMKRFLAGKQVQVHNIYISSFDPVDDWEELKRPLQFNQDKRHTMHVYYLSNQDVETELPRLQQNIGLETIEVKEDLYEIEKAHYVDYYKHQLQKIFHEKKKEVVNILTYGKPKWTYIFIVANFIMFLLLEMNGGSMNIQTLIQFGAKENVSIINGEWWRLFSAMFLHIGIFHLFMNMFALYYLGVTVERIYGTWRFVIIYLLAGLGGSITSFAFSLNVSAGASGAIFGLFGALLFFGVIYKKIFFQTMGRGLMTIIFINIMFGLLVPQIDMGAHMGGLVAGFLASAMLHLPRQKKWGIQILSLLLFIISTFLLIEYGIQHTESQLPFRLFQFD